MRYIIRISDQFTFCIRAVRHFGQLLSVSDRESPLSEMMPRQGMCLRVHQLNIIRAVRLTIASCKPKSMFCFLVAKT
jgi:hypothetical protein